MTLTEPPSSILQKFTVRIILMRQILFFQSSPGLPSFRRCHFRMLIHLMLEMIHQNAVRDELSGSAKMKESILVRILLKEGLHPRPCKEFHTHRVNFTALIGWPDTLHRSDSHGSKHLEGMPCLMSENLRIMACLIKITENKRRAIFGKHGAIASACLSLFTVKIQQVMLHHEIKERSTAFIQLMIHCVCACNHFLCIVFRCRVAACKFVFFIVYVQPVIA